MTSHEAAEFWEARAASYLATADHPETWAERGWQDDTTERNLVAAILGQHAKTVTVIGCGSGRQYAFTQPLMLDEIKGFDISPTLVDVCRARYPMIQTEWDDITNPRHEWEADAVLSSCVLQHIPPTQIDVACANIALFAQKLIILREMVWWDGDADYLWGRDYLPFFPDWNLVFRCPTDMTDQHRTELVMFAK